MSDISNFLTLLNPPKRHFPYFPLQRDCGMSFPMVSKTPGSLRLGASAYGLALPLGIEHVLIKAFSSSFICFLLIYTFSVLCTREVHSWSPVRWLGLHVTTKTSGFCDALNENLWLGKHLKDINACPRQERCRSSYPKRRLFRSSASSNTC